MPDSSLVQWGQQILTQTLTAGVLVAGLKGFIKFAVLDRVKKADDERDEYKELWKGSVVSHRRTRRDVEAVERGAPSVPPPPNREHSWEDKTGRYQIDDAEDRAWQEQRERERVALLNQQALDARPHVERYVSDMTSTPPDPIRAPPRPRMKSRPR